MARSLSSTSVTEFEYFDPVGNTSLVNSLPKMTTLNIAPEATATASTASKNVRVELDLLAAPEAARPLFSADLGAVAHCSGETMMASEEEEEDMLGCFGSARQHPSQGSSVSYLAAIWCFHT